MSTSDMQIETESLCKQCNSLKPIETGFYHQSQTNGNKRRFLKCKDCVRATKKANYTKKPTGFAKLDLEKQEAIRAALTEGTKTNKQIADEVSVSLGSLAYWKRKNYIWGTDVSPMAPFVFVHIL